MRTPSARELERRFLPRRPSELSHHELSAVREHSKRVFGNRDRLEVAVAIARVGLDEVNATDLGKDVAIAVNRIRTQLLALEAHGLLARRGSNEKGKRIYERLDPRDPFWRYASEEYRLVLEGRRPAFPETAEGDG